MFKFSLIVIISTLSVMIVGCNTSIRYQDNTKVTPTLITAEVVATESEMIRISVVDIQEIINGHKHIILLIENISRKEIWFPKDSGIVIKRIEHLGGRI